MSDEGQRGLVYFGWRNRATNGMDLAGFNSFEETERHNVKQRKGVKRNKCVVMLQKIQNKL